MRFWLLVFVVTPIVEMYLLIRVGGYIGAWPAIALVVLTAVVGVALLRVQGLSTLARGMSRLEEGVLPAQEALEALLLAVAGVMLVLPGFATDTIGFLLLVPPLRSALVRRLLARVTVVAPGRPGGGPWRPRSGDRSHIIEGEFRAADDDPEDPRRLP